jgi:hypothetical protein
MKTLYTLLIAMLAISGAKAQDADVRERHRSGAGLVLISAGNNTGEQRSFVRLNYWTSRLDRYWGKWNRLRSRDFNRIALGAPRNSLAKRNDRRAGRYSAQNRQEVKRKDGLIKIN